MPVLTEYAETLTEGGDVLSGRARGFSPVAMWGEEYGHLQAGLEEMGRVEVNRVGSEAEARRGLDEGLFSMVFGPSSTEPGTLTVVLNRGDPRSISAWTSLELIAESQDVEERRVAVEAEIARRLELEQRLSPAEAQSRARNLSELYINPIRVAVSEVSRGSPSASNGDGEPGTGTPASQPAPGQGDDAAPAIPAPSSSFLSLVFLSLGLCFPLLSGSGMMIESITGEKEQRTIEGLFGCSVTRRSILLGKFTSAYVVAAVQSIALVLVLSCILTIHNLPWVVLCLLAVAVAVLSATTMVSVVSTSMKEANLAITILYVLIFVLFFGPLMAPGALAWISPFTPVVRLAAGESFSLVSALAPLVASIVFGCVCLMVCRALFLRDDVVFGPRPSLREVLADVVSSRARGQRGRVLVVAGFGSLATIPAIILPGVFLLPSVAFLGRWGFLLAFAGAALVEEYFKPYGAYLLEPGTGWSGILATGAIAGLSFSLVENLLFTAALSGTGYLRGWALLVRYLLAPALHAGLSTLVVAGYHAGGVRRVATLAMAACIHAAYNLIALLAVF